MKRTINSLKVGDKLLVKEYDPYFFLYGIKPGDVVEVAATATSSREQNRANGVYVGCLKNEIWLAGSHPSLKVYANSKDLNKIKAKLVK